MKKLLIVTIYLTTAILLFGTLSVVQAEECAECEMGALSQEEPPSEIDPNPGLIQRFIFALPGGYVAAGVGMRNRGYGDITISDVPVGSAIKRAYLYWDILDNAESPSFAQGKFNGTPITGIKIGRGPDPCWLPTQNFAYRADVTDLVTGNGTYSLTDFASGRTDGCDAWICTSDLPLMEGASLVVIYRNPASPWQTIVIYNGAVTLINHEYTHTITGFTASDPVTQATITYLGADGQNSVHYAAEDTYFNGVKIADLDWEGSDPQAGPDYSRGNLWDTNTYDVTSLVNPGDTSATAKVRSYLGPQGYYDCLVWVATVFSVSVAPPVMEKPVEGWLIQLFDFEDDEGYEGHQAIDIDSGIDGQDIVAAADGIVVFVQREIIPGPSAGAGLWVWIWHGDVASREGEIEEKISTRYLHLKDIPQEIQPGTKVYGGGTIIGKVSNTGDGYFKWRFDPHLHFEVWQGGSQEIINSAIAQGKAVGTITKLWNPNTEAGKLLEAQNPLRFVKYEDRSKKPDSLTFLALSPVDLVVTDPDGLTVSKDINELPETAWYFEMPIDEDGNPGYEFIAIDERKIGNYSVEVIPEPEALPTDIYSLKVLGLEATVVLAEDVSISEIPEQPHLIKSTETEIIPVTPMKSFTTKEMKIHWSFDHPKHHWEDKTSFTISGSFELPDEYQKEDLDKSALLYIQIADKLGKDKVAFKELKDLWLYQEPWKRKEVDNSLNQGIDIKTMVIHWPEEKECKFFKWWCKEKSAKNWFYVRGELSLEGIDINTLPREATITLEIPLASDEQTGSLAGIETIEFKKFHHTWFYHSLIKWKDWQDGWWKKWDEFDFKNDLNSYFPENKGKNTQY